MLYTYDVFLSFDGLEKQMKKVKRKNRQTD